MRVYGPHLLSSLVLSFVGNCRARLLFQHASVCEIWLAVKKEALCLGTGRPICIGGEVCLEVAGRAPPEPCARAYGEVERAKET